MLKKLASFTTAFTFSLVLAACSPTPTSEGTGGYLDDSVITTKVKTALLAEKGINSTQITVTTFKGKVQLSGFVRSQEEANLAIHAAKEVKGVMQVHNDLLIK